MSVKGKRFLVTGGAGFIGSHTVDALIARGAKVAVVDNLLTGKKRNLNPRAKFYNMNIADSRLENVFRSFRPDYVYHFAFFVLVPKSTENPLLDMDSIVGSVNLLQNCKRYGVKKVIFSSSGFLYGNTKRLPASEKEPVQPISPYVVSKFTIENYLRHFKHNFGLPYVVLRYGAIYGPRQVTGAMAAYIRDLSRGRQSEMYGNGRKTRDYVYIGDVVRANLLALSVKNGHANPVFNVGSGKETSLLDVYKGVAKLLGKKTNPTFKPDRLGEQIRYSLDYSKIKKELGWRPSVTLDDGLRKTLEYWELV